MTADADPAAVVPACPGWNLALLLRHVRGLYRWVDTIVSTRATSAPPDDEFNGASDATDVPTARLGDELHRDAERLAATLREAGPHATVWGHGPEPSPRFWARRALADTVVHRFDAAEAIGVDTRLDAETGAETIEEWLDAGTVPSQTGDLPPGRLVLRATDTDTAWTVESSGGPAHYRRGAGADATVTAHGPLAALILALYGRELPTVTMDGDRSWFDTWQWQAGFWMRK